MEILENKLADLLGWERRKRREQTLVAVSCYAIALAIFVFPRLALRLETSSRKTSCG